MGAGEGVDVVGVGFGGEWAEIWVVGADDVRVSCGAEPAGGVGVEAGVESEEEACCKREGDSISPVETSEVRVFFTSIITSSCLKS